MTQFLLIREQYARESNLDHLTRAVVVIFKHVLAFILRHKESLHELLKVLMIFWQIEETAGVRA